MSDLHTLDRHRIEVFYDGDCPICRREIGMLRRMDRHERIRFTNIADPAFDPQEVGKDLPTLMDSIHGRLSDGTWVEGVEVFRQLYAAVGLGALVAPTRLPGIRQSLDLGYRVFARNRLRFTGRCEGDTCGVRSGMQTEAPADRG